jgi:hypothetical protein
MPDKETRRQGDKEQDISFSAPCFLLLANFLGVLGDLCVSKLHSHQVAKNSCGNWASDFARVNRGMTAGRFLQ